nr:MAG TPA: hypothetical protein [Caudoviricetes sp.]
MRGDSCGIFRGILYLILYAESANLCYFSKSRVKRKPSKFKES